MEQDEVVKLLQEINVRTIRMEAELKSYPKLKERVYDNERALLQLTAEIHSNNNVVDLRMEALESALSVRIQDLEDDVEEINNRPKVAKNALVTSVVGLAVSAVVGIIVMAIKNGWIG